MSYSLIPLYGIVVVLLLTSSFFSSRIKRLDIFDSKKFQIGMI